MGILDSTVKVATVVTALSAMTVTGIVVRREISPQRSQADATSAAHNSRAIPEWNEIAAQGRRIGPAEATLTLIEFGDYECPACTAFAGVARSALARHPKDVALVFRHWPLPYHRFAYPAARAAECAGAQGRFAPYHDLLYEKHDSLGLIAFDRLAARVGVPNAAEFSACSTRSGRVAAIESGIAEAKPLNAWGTPTIIANGTLLGAIPDSGDIERLLVEAKRR